MSKEVIFKSANRVDAPLTKSSLVREAKELAATVATNDVLGVHGVRHRTRTIHPREGD